jgi:acyl-CoA thioester hydrolase
MDAYGHVNNVEFLRLMEEARIQLLTAQVDGAERSLLESGIVVARTEIEYLRPLTYRPQPVAVDLWLTDLGGAWFELAYAFSDGEGLVGSPAAAYARAETTLVPYDLATARPRRLSATERSQLEALRGPPQTWRKRPTRRADV